MWKDSKDGQPSSYLLSILVTIAFARIPDEMKKKKKRGMKQLIPM